MLNEITPAQCKDIKKALQLEWLETNGTGGYASSTILNCHTRKYHGLLISQSDNLPDKQVLLSKFDDWITFNNGRDELRLSVHKYPETFHPGSPYYLQEFSQSVTPSFTYQDKDIKIQKEIMLLSGTNTVLIKYNAVALPALSTLCIKPLLAYRNFHHLSRENLFLRVRTFPCKNGFFMSPYYGMPAFYMQISGKFEFSPSPDWYRNFEYIQEKNRGFEHCEDLFSPGLIEIPFNKGTQVFLSISTDETDKPLEQLWDKEFSRRTESEGNLKGNKFQKTLSKSAAHSFITKKSGQSSVVAGYHWFLEWGRDTMISLPGLTLCAGKHNECLNILKTFAQHEKNGLIPNFLSTNGNAYNSADTSLWFIWAIQKYLESTDDYTGINKYLWPTIKNIVMYYKNGTDYHIKMLENGLLNAGDKETQLTWMDAKVDGKPATTRSGCPVEINALWYNALCFTSALADKFKDEDTAFTDALQSISLEKLRDTFINLFWIQDKGYLGDVWSDGGLDSSIRPNQIFAVSMPYSMIPIDMSRRLIKVVENELLTPFGLRTLSKSDPKYIGKYCGNSVERDKAYHNGTVWPWLLGHFCEALLKTSKDKKAELTKIRKILSNFSDHLNEAGIGFISEVFDGDPPHLAGGCIAQTWNSAELLRISYMIES
ncbi:MAG: glycogen debranching enzyme family protein [Planctomycetes bacterium]|nr:glycogen debranching enzyme family protein [Planctomycetota bacterium]